MKENNLKFCLNSLVQLLDEWGWNFFSWEKIFDEEDNNAEIDFKKYIKNEDFLEVVAGFLNDPDYVNFVLKQKEISEQVELIRHDENQENSNENSLEMQFLSNPFFEKFYTQIMQSNISNMFMNMANNMESLFKKHFDYQTFMLSDSKPTVTQILKSVDLEKFRMDYKDLMGWNASTFNSLLGLSDTFNKNNPDFIADASNSFGIPEDVMKIDTNLMKKLEKKYVFNAIFEIIKTEGCKKIFQYTFSEAAKIMRSSKIIKSTLL